MSEKLDTLYMKALKAVAKGYRTTSPGRRIPEEDRKVLKLYAKWIAEDPVFAAEVKRQKLPVPSAENLAKASYRNALKEIVRLYKSGWGREKVAPEHRESIVKEAASISGRRKSKSERDKYGEYGYLPHKLSKELEAARRQRKKNVVVLVGDKWFTVDGVAKGDRDDKPYFIGVGVGYDILRYVVFAHSEDVAYEIAEETWPKVFFDDITKNVPADEEDSYQYIPSLGKWGKREEDIRIFEKAREFHNNAVKVGDNLYRLKDGRIIEAR